MPVSIHAPVWGATGSNGSGGVVFLHVSIHAPVWGATAPARDELVFELFQSTRPCGARLANRPGLHRNSTQFQSTRPCGARPMLVCFGNLVTPVSIHAPVWGATGSNGSGGVVFLHVSIHAPVWGATAPARDELVFELFQSTRPCGARLANRPGLHRNSTQFQSTRPCGARPMLVCFGNLVTPVSIHAPVWGAT